MRRMWSVNRSPIRLLSVGLCLSMAYAASALEWPVENPVPAATFGTPARGRFIVGIALASDSGIVRSAGEGELVFYRDGAAQDSVLPSTLGSFAIVEHDRNMAGVYSQILPGSISSYLTKMKTGSMIGIAGKSGWIEGNGLLFSVFDRAALRWVNPLLVLPHLKDKSQPLIRSAALVRDGKNWILGEDKSAPQGNFIIAVDFVDPVAAAWSAGSSAPYFIRLTVDGSKAAELEYDVAIGREGELVLFPASPKSRTGYLVSENRAFLAERLFRHGKTVIEVLVRDYAGNERSASWSINIE